MKITKIFNLLLLIPFSITATRGFPQNATIGKISISSPNAASLGKYGDIPVNNHTGIPEINIPIYNVKSGSLQLPISLSYHASGLKVQEQASWVGAGWALNVGGVITRTVVGAPDDKGLTPSNTDRGHFSDYGYNNYLFSSGPASCDPNPNGNGPAYCPEGTTYAPQDSYFQSGKFDGEPDLYFFNFNGIAGKFYFNDDRTPIIVPEQDIKITPIYTGTDWRGMTGFFITTSDGTRYIFGANQDSDGNIDAIDVTYNISTQSSFNGHGAVSSWFLNKIISADGQFEIKISYQFEHYSTYSLSMYPIPSIRNPNFFAYNLEYDLDKNFIDGVRLSKIEFLNGEVDFNAGALRQDLGFGKELPVINDIANTSATLGAKALGSIDIKSGDFCKRYTFNTSFFLDNTPLTGELLTVTYPNLNLQSDKYRLRLDGVQESACDNSISIPPYIFTYEQGTVPRKLSFGIDHWGFFNGVNSNRGLIPTYKIVSANNESVTKPGADRDTHWPGSLGGVLKQITYPTGGYTDFNFESNVVSSKTTTIDLAPLTYLIIHMSGQSQNSYSTSFASTQNSLKLKLVNNSTNKTAYFSIKNSANSIIYSTPIYVNSTVEPTISTPPGNYQALLEYQDVLSFEGGGAEARVSEYITSEHINNIQVGGVRINSISQNDGIGSPAVNANYTYNYDRIPNGLSSGVLYERPVYVQALRNDVWGIVNGQTCSPSGCFVCFGSDAAYYQSPSSIRPMSSMQGNHIGYGQVYVSQVANGYTLYKYYGMNGSLSHVYDPPISDVCIRTLSTFCDPDIPNSPAPPELFDPKRGELAYEESYNESNELIKSILYSSTYQNTSLKTPAIISRFYVTGYQLPGQSTSDPRTVFDQDNLNISNTQAPIGIYTFTEYTLQSTKKIQSSITTSLYDPVVGNYITSTNTTYFESNFHNSPTRTVAISSRGEEIKATIKSSFDFRISNYNVSDGINNYNLTLNSDLDYLSDALDAITTSSSDPHYYWNRLNVFTNYRYKMSLHRKAFVRYRLDNFASTGSTYALAFNSAKASANNDLKPILELQCEFINAPIETSTFKSGMLLSSAFNKYDYVTNPFGYVYPKATQKINLPSPSLLFTQAAVNNNTLNKDERYEDEESYLFSKGVLVEVISRDGLKTSYLYGYHNSYPVMQIVGSDHQTISGLVTQSILDDPLTNQALESELNRIRLAQSNLKSLITTFSYKPLVGIINQTDNNRRSTYYFYDALGRLILIKDKDLNIMKVIDYKYKITSQQ